MEKITFTIDFSLGRRSTGLHRSTPFFGNPATLLRKKLSTCRPVPRGKMTILDVIEVFMHFKNKKINIFKSLKMHIICVFRDFENIWLRRGGGGKWGFLGF